MTARKKLIEFWDKTIGDKVKTERAAKSLQRQAEIDVAEAHESYENAQTTFEKAKLDAKDDTKEGFKKIVKSYKDMLIEKKKFDDTVAMYEALFEEKPRLLE